MLAREMVQELQDGDSLSFPGGRFVFEVHEKDGGVQLGLEAGAEDSAPSLPLSSFGARRRSGHSDDEASSGATAVQPAQETLRKLRTDILKEFESPSRRGSRDSTVADGNSASAARFTAGAAAHTAEQGGTELQELSRQELARARADLAAERQLREEAERRLRTTERAVSRGRHQVIHCCCIERTLHKHMQPGYKIPYFKSSSRFQAASTFLEHPCQRLCVPRRLSVSGNASSIIRCAAIFVRLMRNRCAYALLTFFSIIVVSVMTVPGSPICASLGFSAGSLQFLWSVESTLG